MSQFNNSSDLLIKRLYSKADGVTEVVLLDELNKVTLDVIAKVTKDACGYHSMLGHLYVHCEFCVECTV